MCGAETGGWQRGGKPGRGFDTSAGYVTAEAAVVIPALVLFVALLLWGVLAAITRIQCVDAARAGARAAARGESAEGVRAVVREAGPSGVSVETSTEGELVRVTVQARALGPGPMAVRLTEEAVASGEGEGGVGGDVATGGADLGQGADAGAGAPDGETDGGRDAGSGDGAR